ncbi:MAG: anti-sigma factor [Actinomycetota bacterium]|nr:anti-sigma factor [Actinomycetota bacterium]
MSDERRERFEDLKEAYALGALPEDERLWFEGYLAEHPELQAEVDDLASVANLLALAPPEYEPSPELRRNLLSTIEGAPGAALAERFPLRARLGELFGPGGIVAAAVAVVAVVGLFAWNASQRGENEDLRGELQNRRTHELEGSGAARDVRGEVVEVGDGRAVLVAENLPAVPEGQVYEAWLMRGEDAKPAGLFEPREEGTAAVPLEGSLEGFDSVAVTLEPSGGSPTPTSDVLLTADL